MSNDHEEDFYHQVPKVKCPKCGWEDKKGSGLRIQFGDAAIDGEYCMKCWSTTISKTTPKMEPV